MELVRQISGSVDKEILCRWNVFSAIGKCQKDKAGIRFFFAFLADKNMILRRIADETLKNRYIHEIGISFFSTFAQFLDCCAEVKRGFSENVKKRL